MKMNPLYFTETIHFELLKLSEVSIKRTGLTGNQKFQILSNYLGEVKLVKISNSLISDSWVEAKWLTCKNLQVLTRRCIALQVFLPKTCKFLQVNHSNYKLTIRLTSYLQVKHSHSPHTTTRITHTQAQAHTHTHTHTHTLNRKKVARHERKRMFVKYRICKSVN